MRGWLYGGAAAATVLLTAGFAVATSPPAPPADPIGDVIAQPQTPTQPETSLAPTLPPEEVHVPTEVLQDAGIAAAETEAEEEDDEEGRPLPPLPEALPRVRQQVAIIQALDKITAETIRFAVPVGQSRRWRGVVFRARACETTAPDEPMRDSIAFLEVRSQPRVGEGQNASRQIFQGWMFASSPGLSPLEHPLYDVWVISCQASMPTS